MIKKIHYIPLFVIAILGIIFGSFYDLQINQAIYSYKNGFGIAMAAFGCAPIYIGLGVCAIGYILFGLKLTKLWQKISLITLGILTILVGTYFQADMLVSVNAFDIEHMLFYVGVPVGLLVVGIGCLIGYFIFKNVDVESDIYLLMLLLAAPVILGISNIMTQIIKDVMCRPRFRVLISHQEFVSISGDFRNWWEIGKDVKADYLNRFADITSEEFESFPSGHVTTASCLIGFLVYGARLNSNYEKYQVLMFYVGLIWAMMMGFSRMLIGAHYLSDVSFGLLFFSIVFVIIDLIFFKNKKKNIIEAKVE